MEWHEVNSKVLAEVGYSRSNRTLTILFRDGAIYDYYLVPEGAYEELMDAGSKGTYFNAHIKGVYDEHQVAEPYDGPSKKRGRPG